MWCDFFTLELEDNKWMRKGWWITGPTCFKKAGQVDVSYIISCHVTIVSARYFWHLKPDTYIPLWQDFKPVAAIMTTPIHTSERHLVDGWRVLGIYSMYFADIWTCRVVLQTKQVDYLERLSESTFNQICCILHGHM